MRFLKIISYILTVVLVLLMGLFPFIHGGFDVLSPDSARLMIGADHLLDHGVFRQNLEDYGGVLSDGLDVGVYYPLIQLLVALVSSLLGVSVFVGYAVLMVCLFFLFAFFIYFVFKNIAQHDDRWWSVPLLGVLAFAFSSSIVRSYVLVPQNFIGYFLLCISVSGFFYFYVKKRLISAIIFLLSCFAMLLFVHHLSFGVLALSFLLFLHVLLFRKNYPYFFGLLFVEIVVFSFFVFLMPDFVYGVIASGFEFEQIELKNVTNARYLFSSLGHSLVLLSLFGLFEIKKIFSHGVRAWMASYVAVISVFAFVLPLFGYVFFPDRFVLYLWAPLVLLFPFGCIYFKEKSLDFFGRWNSRIFLLIIIVVLVGQGVMWSLDGMTFFSRRFSHFDELSAVSGLIDDDVRVMYSLRGPNESALLLPLLIDNSIIASPDSSLYQFPVQADNDGFEHIDSPNDALRYGWFLSAYADEEYAQKFLARENVGYYLIGRDSRLEYRLEVSEFWSRIYSSDQFVLYERKK